MASRNSNTTQQTSDQQLLAGLQMNQAALPASWNLLGATYTLAQLITMLTTRVAAVAAVATAKAAYAAAVLAADNERTTTKPQVDAVRQQNQGLVGQQARRPGRIRADRGQGERREVARDQGGRGREGEGHASRARDEGDGRAIEDRGSDPRVDRDQHAEAGARGRGDGLARRRDACGHVGGRRQRAALPERRMTP